MCWDYLNFFGAVVLHLRPHIPATIRLIHTHRTPKSITILLHNWRLDHTHSLIEILIWEDLWQLLGWHVHRAVLLYVHVWIIIQRRHLCCESVDRPAKLVQNLIGFELTATLPSMSLTIVSLKSIGPYRIVHGTTVNPCQPRLPIRNVANVFNRQNLQLR